MPEAWMFNKLTFSFVFFLTFLFVFALQMHLGTENPDIVTIIKNISLQRHSSNNSKAQHNAHR